MKEKEKQEYLEQYHQAKEKGLPFFPNILFKDAVISLLVFLILVALAYFLGTPLEARADPADTTSTPRPSLCVCLPPQVRSPRDRRCNSQ